jgi:hypothetical protein
MLGFKVIQHRLSAIASKQSSVTLNRVIVFILNGSQSPDSVADTHIIQDPLKAKWFVVWFCFS